MSFRVLPATLPIKSVMWHLVPSVSVGPQLKNGRRQIAQSGLGYWTAKLSMYVNEPDEIREARSFVIHQGGGAREVLIPATDRRQAPWPSGVTAATPKPTVGGGMIGSGARQNHIQVKTVGVNFAGETKMTVTLVRSGELLRGQFFSMTDKGGRARLYEIQKVETVSGSPASRVIDFAPELRALVLSGTFLNFDDPQCTMTMADPMTGQMELERYYSGTVELAMRESFSGL